MATPYNIQIPEASITDLKRRLAATRWPDSITNSKWEYGTDISYLRNLTEYWKNEFDWRRTEKKINSFPNFIFEASECNVHFICVKGSNTSSPPLLVTHGWPGSFLEMLKIIPLLTADDEGLSFDVVIPSLPGFGFSSKVTHPGCNSWFIANLWNKLMETLGYDKYFVQGGDFGAGVGTALALRYPKNILGLHLNYIPGSYYPPIKNGESFTVEETNHLLAVEKWIQDEGAYAHQQKTKPLTLAYALNDSPTGLCGWIIEKFQRWSDCNGILENVFTKDELLSNVSLYWFTETIHSSIRLYNENSRKPLSFKVTDFVNVPVGVAKFAKEEPFPPRRFIERGYNITHWSEFVRGGHFAAMECPDLLAKDIRDFVRNVI